MYKSKELIYNPCAKALNVAKDWNIDPACLTDNPNAKIAALRVFYNEPHVYSYDPEVAKIDASKYDFVILSDAEYSQPREMLDWIQRNNIQRYVLAVGGKISGWENLPANWVYRSFWLERFLEVNHDVIYPNKPRPYRVDALLGARRPNRDYVMLALQQIKLLEHSIVTYRDCFPGGYHDEQSNAVAARFSETLEYPYVSSNLNPAWEPRATVDNTISFYTPHEIYSRTDYTMLTETINQGRDLFFSEKIMKACWARRVFVHFGAQYFLKNLRELGFKTFHGVIDESYDNIDNTIDRYAAAFVQVEELLKQDPVLIRDRTWAITEHNHCRLQELLGEQQQDMFNLLTQNLV
jgi:hypothetical protein